MKTVSGDKERAQRRSQVPPPVLQPRQPPSPPSTTTSTFFFSWGGGKLQGLTSKSKVQRRNQNVSRTPNKNHRSPHSCDEEKQWRLQSQHHFQPPHPPFFFPPDLHVLPFASPALRNAVKETSSGNTAGRRLHNSILFFSFSVWRLPAHVQ